MAEHLGEAVLDLDADLLPLDRSLVEAERKTALWLATTQAMIDRGMGPISTRIGGVGTAFDQQLTPPLARFGAATDIMAKKVDGSLSQMRIEQAATAREMERAAAAAEVAGGVQTRAAERTARAYEEQALAAREAADAQDEAARRRADTVLSGGLGPNETRRASELPAAPPSTQQIIERVGGGDVWGVRGPHAAGSMGNPIVMVMEAANRTGLGSLAAAIGESSASGGARSTTIADGGGGGSPTTVVATSGGSGGGGVPPVAISSPGAAGGGGGGGGGGGFLAGGALTEMIMGRGGGGGGRPPGWLGYALGPAIGATAAAGSAGSFAGFGVEHLLTTILGLLGSAAGGVAGGGLLGLGSLGKIAVGGGSDMAVMKSTIADTKSLAEGYKNVQTAVGKYGAESKQAAMAQHELNMLIAELGGGPGVKAELALAKQGEALNHFWDKATQNARVQAVGILSQVLTLATDFVPKVAQAAEINLAVINKGIKPLFGWLEGPQGMGIFNALENRFRHDLPTAIHAGTQSLELLLRVTEIASRFTGGFIRSLDHLATRLNSLDNAMLSQWIGKLVGDFRIWSALIKVVGQDIYYLFKQDAGTASSIVVGLTHALERLREWEKSARGSAQIQSIFAVHREQIEALGRAVLPLIETFGKLYLAIAPTAVETTITLLTKVLTPFAEALAWVASQGKGAAVAMGLLLISFKAFGIGGTISGLKGIFTGLTAAEVENAAAANADAAASARLAAAQTAVGASGGAAALGESVAGAGGVLGATRGMAAKGGILGFLGRTGSGAQGAVEGGALRGAGLLEALGMGGAASGLAGAGGVLGPIAGVGLPALLAGGGGALAGNFLSNALGLHGVSKGGLTGALGGAAAGAAVGSIVPGFGTLIGAGVGGVAGLLGGGTLGGLLGGGKRTVELKSMAEAAKLTSAQIGALIKEIEHVKDVKVSGVEVPWKVVVEQLRTARRSTDDWNRSWDKAWVQIHNFSLGSGPLLKTLADRFDTNFKLIAHTMGLNSATGRKLAEENVSQMVGHIGRAIHDGKVPVDVGMRAISDSIAKYTRATGDNTPKVYEVMFSKIEAMYQRHEIGTKTAFTSFSTVAASQTKHMVGDLQAKRAAMFAHFKTQYDNGEVTQQQYERKTKSHAKVTAAEVEGAMGGMTGAIVNAIEQGALSSKDGGTIIFKNLNALLKKFGAPELSAPAVAAYTSSYRSGKGVTGGVGAGGSSGGSSANNEGENPHSHAARGALIQIGNMGEAGHDTVPLNVGGMPIAVAPGEQVAVFNRHQLPEVNAALEERGWGGLSGLFDGISTPNYMAQGGMVPGFAKGGYAAGLGGVDSGVASVVSDVLAHFAGLAITSTTGGKHASGSLHYLKEAVDLGGPSGLMLKAADWVGKIWGRSLEEGIHNPNLSIKHGARVPSSVWGEPTWAEHLNHIHLGVLGGQAVPGGAGGLGGGTPAWQDIKAPGIRGGGAIAAIARAALRKATHAANTYGRAHISGVHGAPSGGHAAGNAQMRAWAKAGLQAAGLPGSPDEVSTIVYTMTRESGGNPLSENKWDSNAKAGHPSRGLMELIPENFAQYRVKSLPNNVFDPVANVAAAVRYMIARYGHIVGMSPYARGGMVRGFAPGGLLAHASAATPKYKAGKPKGVRHVKRPAKPRALSLKNVITTLGKIPGMAHIGAELGPQEATYNLLGDEQQLLSTMTSNPASILGADMAYLNPTLAAGENIGPGMRVPHAERELQRALQAHGESPGLSLQGSLLQWIGGLDDHRLLSGPDVGVLAKDFVGHSEHKTIHGLPLGVGYPVFKGEQSVLEAQVRAQIALVAIQRHEKDRAVSFIKKRQKRKRQLEALLKAVYQRYRNIQKRLALLKTAGLRRKLSQAQAKHAAAIAHQQEQQDVSEHRAALRDSIAAEKEMNPWEQNHALLRGWQAEERHLAGVASKPAPSTAAIDNAHEALERNSLQNELKGLGDQLHVLGGSSSSIGHGGEWAIETKQISGLKAGADELDGKIRESVQSTIPQLELSIAGIRDSLAEAAESVAPATIPSAAEKPGESELASLLKQQNEQLALQLAVSQAQYKVFAAGDLPPFAGRFHSGGIVPGPLGAERMALVQGGETITPPGQQMYFQVVVEDGAVDKGKIRVIAVDAAQTVVRRMGANAMRPLPSRGGGG